MKIIVVVLGLVVMIQQYYIFQFESKVQLLERTYKEQQSVNTNYIVQLEDQVFTLNQSIEELQELVDECIKKNF